MCGILGYIGSQANEQKERFQQALRSMQHRGPDGNGIAQYGQVLLGHLRLSIIDTSTNAAQPFTDITERYTLTFNGEIFNYKELRQTLEGKGIIFKSTSDTEVLLNMLILYKEKCMDQLNGFFSFIFYDKLTQEVLIARDRYGVKPLYYQYYNNQLLVASELKALIKLGVEKEIDQDALYTYIQLNYIPSPQTIFKNVNKLNAGHYIKYRISDSSFEIQPYYHLPTQEQSPFPDYATATSEVRRLLEKAVQDRLVADVPLGTFLSGGVDSSIVTAIAAKYQKNIHSFSIGFKDEPFFDETKYAQLVANKHHTEHTVFSLGNNDLYENLFDFLDYIDEPFADSSALNVYILSKHTRKHITVALSGDGADELFAGYNKHEALLKSQQKSLTNTVLKNSTPLLNFMPKSRNGKLSNIARQLAKYNEGLQLNEQERYWRWAGYCNEKQAEQLLIKQHGNNYKQQKDSILKSISNDFNGVLRTDFKLVLQNDMLVKVDMMSMANSLEVRTPFLDFNLVNYVFGLPVNYKIQPPQRKRILIDAFKQELPFEVYMRKKKGFEVPLLKWFQTELRSTITDKWLNKEFVEEQGVFNYTEIELLKQQLFSTNPNDAIARIWAIIVFQHWWQKYFN